MRWVEEVLQLSEKRKINKKLPEKYIFIAFEIRIITIIKKKIFRESNFQSNFLGFDSEKLVFVWIIFLENIENGFVLILPLKKGGWSYTRRGLIRGILRVDLRSDRLLVTRVFELQGKHLNKVALVHDVMFTFREKHCVAYFNDR